MSSTLMPASRRALATIGAVGALLLMAALPAAAHVTVSSPDASAGGFGKLVFRVPTESDTTSTTKVQVTLPAATPFAFVSSKPHAGWTIATVERKLDKPIEAEGFKLSKAVATVTWTATKGNGIKPGQFDEFELSVGPFPAKAQTLSLPAVQTYDDGTVVKWDDVAKDAAAEPEHPAPHLDLTAAEDTSSKSTAPAAATSPAKAAQSGSDDSDPVARWLAGVGVLLAAGALGVAVVGRRRRPR
jgi:uncharacterized protein YcnI